MQNHIRSVAPPCQDISKVERLRARAESVFCPACKPQFPTGKERWGDYFRYVCHLIEHSYVFREIPRGSFVPLKYDYLKRFIPARELPLLLACLHGEGLVECDYQKRVGIKCYGYRLGPEIHDVGWTKDKLSDLDLIRKRLKYYLELEKSVTYPVDLHLLEWLEVVELDPGAVTAALETEDPDSSSYAVASIMDKSWFFSMSRYGRIYHNVATLSRSLRPYLRIHGKPIAWIDVANSQPLFLGILSLIRELNPDYRALFEALASDKKLPRGRKYVSLDAALRPKPRGGSVAARRKTGEGIGQGVGEEGVGEESITAHRGPKTFSGEGFASEKLICKDLSRYLGLCSQGLIYERLMEISGESDRDRMKVRLYNSVLFCGDIRTPLFIAIEKEFPTVAATIREMKGIQDNALIHALTRLEASMIYDRIVRRVMDENHSRIGRDAFIPILTIHDAVGTTPEHLDWLRGVVKEEFAELGFNVTVKG